MVHLDIHASRTAVRSRSTPWHKRYNWARILTLFVATPALFVLTVYGLKALVKVLSVALF